MPLRFARAALGLVTDSGSTAAAVHLLAMVRTEDAGLLAAFAAATLAVFFIIWAALHDIARGDAGIEYIALAAGAVAFGLLYRAAVRHLDRKTRLAWLLGTGLLILLFDVAAVSSRMNPKYPLDALVASWFLAVGLPALAAVVVHAARLFVQRRMAG